MYSNDRSACVMIDVIETKCIFIVYRCYRIKRPVRIQYNLFNQAQYSFAALRRHIEVSKCSPTTTPTYCNLRIQYCGASCMHLCNYRLGFRNDIYIHSMDAVIQYNTNKAVKHVTHNYNHYLSCSRVPRMPAPKCHALVVLYVVYTALCNARLQLLRSTTYITYVHVANRGTKSVDIKCANTVHSTHTCECFFLRNYMLGLDTVIRLKDS